jgi:hypothetical protein
MKVIALKEHACYCCGTAIAKGEACFAVFVNPSDPKSNEFDVFYTCSKCINEESCKVRMKGKGAALP